MAFASHCTTSERTGNGQTCSFSNLCDPLLSCCLLALARGRLPDIATPQLTVHRSYASVSQTFSNGRDYKQIASSTAFVSNKLCV